MEPLILGLALCYELCFYCSIYPPHQSFTWEETEALSQEVTYQWSHC